MRVYSKTGKRWSHDYKFEKVYTLDKVDLTSTNTIYYHHPYDSLMERVPLLDSLNLENWEHIKAHKHVCLIHDNDSETFTITFAEDVLKTIQKYNLTSDDLKIIVMDENHKAFLENFLKDRGCQANITVCNYLLNHIKTPKLFTNDTTHKFSSLSRNYRNWRLKLYASLLENDILSKHFVYSFFNIWPYDTPPKVFSKEYMINDLKTITDSSISQELENWITACPHELSSTNSGIENKWSNITYDAIQSSDFHVVIETHYDQSYYTSHNVFSRSFAPSSITEKTYKAIACKRPFIEFSTPYILEDLRKLGFKTFSPWIKEGYDLEIDNHKRLNMIVAEIERICNLSSVDYAILVHECKEITEYNFKVLLEKKNAQRNL
jgi:hypothetical protein